MKKITFIALAAVLAPTIVMGQTATVSFQTAASYSTGVTAEFNVAINDYQNAGNATSTITVADTAANQLGLVQYLGASGWTTVSMIRSGNDMIGSFGSNTGFLLGNQKVITMRMVFATAKIYVLGYTLTNSSGRVLASAAQPVTVTGSSILGENTTTQFTRPLQLGSRGNDVTALQNRLTMEGVYSGPITGYFGVMTRAAVRAYQAAHGIRQTGTVGPATLVALNQ